MALQLTPLASRQCWEHIASLARFAPTPHNTQPYRLQVVHDGAEVVLLPERLLPVEDDELRYGRATAGIFAVAIERAAAAHGLAVEITLRDPGPTPTGAAVVVGHVSATGRIAPDPRAADLLRTRRTSRLPYLPQALPRAVQRSLRAAMQRHGHELQVESDPAVVQAVLRQNAEAIIDNLQIPEDRRELGQWVRLGPTPAHGDGLWQEPLAQPAWEVRAGLSLPRAFNLPGLRSLAVWRHMRTSATPHVALLRGPFESFEELVSGGRALMDLWLEMARHQVYMHPFGSLLTHPGHARAVASRFGHGDIWLVVRLGYSHVPPAAPRLALEVTP